jgi:Domain of unknown function (DUF4832)/Domain of unknown function (DUF4874)
MDAGFIGQWGEWHSSVLAANLSAKSQVLSTLLAILPQSRTVAIRAQKDKKAIYNTTSSINPSDAFPTTGPRTNRARTAHFNDCFARDFEDFGTYNTPYTIANIEAQKDYLSQENQYLPQTGESCGYDSATVEPLDPWQYAGSYTDCIKAKPEARRMRWSVLSGDYSMNAINAWTTQGCYEEMKRKLGYRYRLTSATLPAQVTKGQTLVVILNMINEGWAQIYNPRGLELVLRPVGTTGAGTRLTVNPGQNVRLFLPTPCVDPCNTPTPLNLSVTVPGTLASGSYDLFLNLPDPESTLNTNPAYSIHLANLNMWQSSTTGAVTTWYGYNKLGTLAVQ